MIFSILISRELREWRTALVIHVSSVSARHHGQICLMVPLRFSFTRLDPNDCVSLAIVLVTMIDSYNEECNHRSIPNYNSSGLSRVQRSILAEVQFVLLQFSQSHLFADFSAASACTLLP